MEHLKVVLSIALGAMIGVFLSLQFYTLEIIKLKPIQFVQEQRLMKTVADDTNTITIQESYRYANMLRDSCRMADSMNICDILAQNKALAYSLHEEDSINAVREVELSDICEEYHNLVVARFK